MTKENLFKISRSKHQTSPSEKRRSHGRRAAAQANDFAGFSFALSEPEFLEGESKGYNPERPKGVEGLILPENVPVLPVV